MQEKKTNCCTQECNQGRDCPQRTAAAHQPLAAAAPASPAAPTMPEPRMLTTSVLRYANYLSDCEAQGIPGMSLHQFAESEWAPAAPVAQPLAPSGAVLVLTVDEADFVLRVLANPGCKINDFAADGRWQKPESLGLVKVVGSWKWEPTGKLVELLRAALAAQPLAGQVAAPVVAQPERSDAPAGVKERERALIEFYEASRHWEGVCGHPEATVEDERKAEERFATAGIAVQRALAAPSPQPTDSAATSDDLPRELLECRHAMDSGVAVFDDPIGRVAARYAAQPSPQPARSTVKPLTRCAANRDGECGYAQCPQLRDGEPAKSGRHCPIDNHTED